jgi:hypothetical protein
MLPRVGVWCLLKIVVTFLKGKLKMMYEVMNGYVGVSDVVAFSTRFASSCTMNIARVLELTEHVTTHGKVLPALAVEVIQTSDDFDTAAYKTVIHNLGSVVRLS